MSFAIVQEPRRNTRGLHRPLGQKHMVPRRTVAVKPPHLDLLTGTPGRSTAFHRSTPGEAL